MGYKRTSTKKTPKATITDIMIERIEARREAGENVVAPWRMTWDPSLGMPRNLVTGHAYRGVNVFMTLFAGFESPFWVTRKQVAKIGGSVKKDEDGNNLPYTPILFWKFPTKEEEAEGRRAFCRFYQVWNCEQVNGINDKVEEAFAGINTETKDPIAEAEALVSGYPAAPEIKHGGSSACYTVGNDTVSIPVIGAFESSEAYYRALFHELAHSTGHRKRLEREGIANPAKYADHAYSEEELIAEMTASMMAGHSGIATEEADENSAAYLDHWLKKLKAEPNLLVSAGGAAQRALDHIRNIKWATAEKAKPEIKGMYHPKAKIAAG